MTNFIRHIIYFTVLLTISCKDKKYDVNIITIFKPPLVIDILPKTNTPKVANSIDLTFPEIIAVNSFSDSCNLTNYFYSRWSDTTIKNTLVQRSDGLQFLVDTTQTVTIKYNKEEDYYYTSDTTQTVYKGYPCFVYNETSELKWLATQDSRVMVIQEAMDSSYNWRPIQIWAWAWCGNSYYKAPIKPNHYLLFKTPLYKGNFYADIRLKLYSRDATYYSNIFKGWIDYKQFNLSKKMQEKNGKPIINYGFL